MKLSDDGDAVQNYVGGEPLDVPHKYKEACSMCNIDLLKHVDVTVVLGSLDDDVPQAVVQPLVEQVQVSRGKTGNWECRTFECDHFQLVQAGEPPWLWVGQRISRTFSLQSSG